MAIRSRAILGLLLAVTLAVPGLLVGTAAGALLFVSPGRGLAGIAGVLGYGLLGALLAAAAAVALAWRLPPSALRRTLAVSTAVAFVGLCLIAYRVYEVRRQAVHLRAAGPGPLRRPYEVLVEVTEAGAEVGPPVREIRFQQTAKSRSVVWISRDPEPQRCEDAMVGLEGADLAARLQAFAPAVAGGVEGCGDDPGRGPVLYRVHWQASGQLTPATQGELAMTAACLRGLQLGRDLMDKVRAVHDRALTTAACTPVAGGLALR